MQTPGSSSLLSKNSREKKQKQKAYDGSVIILSIIKSIRNNKDSANIIPNHKEILFSFFKEGASIKYAERDLYVWDFYHQGISDEEMKLKLLENCQKSSQDRFFAAANMQLYYISKKKCNCVDDVKTLPIEIVHNASKSSKRIFAVKFPMSKKGNTTVTGTAIELEKEIKTRFPKRPPTSQSKYSKQYVYIPYLNTSPKLDEGKETSDYNNSYSWDESEDLVADLDTIKPFYLNNGKEEGTSKSKKKKKKIYGDLGTITLSPSSPSSSS